MGSVDTGRVVTPTHLVEGPPGRCTIVTVGPRVLTPEPRVLPGLDHPRPTRRGRPGLGDRDALLRVLSQPPTFIPDTRTLDEKFKRGDQWTSTDIPDFPVG